MKGGKLKDYMPWPREDEDAAFDPAVMAAKLKAVAARNNARLADGRKKRRG